MIYKKNCLVLNSNLKNIYQNYKNKKYIIASFYKYFFISNPEKLLFFIKKILVKENILGRIYISTEGINASISIPYLKFKYIKNFFKNINQKTKKMYINYSIEKKQIAFFDLRIKIKKQIVSSKIKNFFFNNKNHGIYLTAHKVNKYIFNKDCVFVDMRNSYEYEIGHFYNSLTIPANTFREQLKKLPESLKLYKKKKIIMYCTGGIRCEKSTVLLKNYGFSKIYQIHGGILKYIKQTKKYNLPNYFQGKIFVFDARLSIKITNDIFSKCINCNKYTNRLHINCYNSSCNHLFIQCVFCSIQLSSCCSIHCKDTIYRQFIK
ncbi:rhodanese-related sulfurtransferase [Buchnera aphidicola]|uniref:tRNA uridine(34) hydroxylase n=1 Tax=Buchnera aphidicola subsp. Cinara cedri (strain Cc) TaxID=372461 RepID=Q057K8_BUCCC|nr:rhodanese-related sulfurtransferase [Buchnera aphidicola]ABJ90691.1 putative Rhodanese/Cell cycle control phosphatase [Buchnera aphidicola BCc]